MFECGNLGAICWLRQFVMSDNFFPPYLPNSAIKKIYDIRNIYFFGTVLTTKGDAVNNKSNYWPVITSMHVSVVGSIKDSQHRKCVVKISEEIETEGFIEYLAILTVFDPIETSSPQIMVTAERSPLGTTALGIFFEGTHKNLGSMEDLHIDGPDAFVKYAFDTLGNRFGYSTESFEIDENFDQKIFDEEPPNEHENLTPHIELVMEAKHIISMRIGDVINAFSEFRNNDADRARLENQEYRAELIDAGFGVESSIALLHLSNVNLPDQIAIQLAKIAIEDYMFSADSLIASFVIFTVGYTLPDIAGSHLEIAEKRFAQLLRTL